MSTSSTVVLPKSKRSLSRDRGTPFKQNDFKEDLKLLHNKVILSKSTQEFHSHGLIHLRHFPLDSPVRFMMYSEYAAAPISLHSDNTVCLYDADGNKRTLSAHFPYVGLIDAKIPGCFVGWGPGARFELLDSELRQLDDAPNGLDINVCQAAEHSMDLVTAGAGNVCVWSVLLMNCKLKIQEGLEQWVFTHLALVPPQSGRHHIAFVACGHILKVVDLDEGKVLKNKRRFSSSDITAMVYCVQLDCVIIASERGTIKIFSCDLESRGAFSGHKGVVNSLLYCIESSMLVCSTNKGTMCRWNVNEHDPIECIHTEQKIPQLCTVGTRKGDSLFSYSHEGVNIWTYRSLYWLHCQLARDESIPLRQIVVTQFPAPYPTRVLCVSGDYEIFLVASETGDVLTSFRAKSKILCADYCLHRETLLVLTEERTVLQANTRTNPITVMEEWGGTGQESCQWMHPRKKSDDQDVEFPGPACCLALYTSVTDEEEAFQKWTSLQERKGRYKNASFPNAKNQFLVILGQSGGYVSVLKLNLGDVMCRMRAHNGQRVTRVQVYPENSCLLSTGEDHTVAVWRVNPYVDECLTPQLSLQCGSPQVYLAALGPLLALTFEDPFSHFYTLQYFDIHRQSQTGHQPKKGHLGHFTGLCVFPEMKVFISSSVDKKLCIWNEKNRLLRTLHLNAVPQCIGHRGFGDEMFLGIKGDLYKMNCANFLRGSDQPKIADPDSAAPPADLPIPIQRRKVKGRGSQPILEEPFLINESYPEKDIITTLSMDLEALVQCAVQCKKGKPPSTKQTRKEAFERYMKIIYGLLPTIKEDIEGLLEPSLFRPFSSRQQVSPFKKSGRLLKSPKDAVEPSTETIKKRKKKKVPVSFDDFSDDDEEDEFQRWTSVSSRSSTSYSSMETYPETMPAFLRPFVQTHWFKDVFTDIKHIPRTLSPDDFALKLLGYLKTCRIRSRVEIVSSLQSLHHQGLLQNTDELYQGLLETIHIFSRPPMTPEEQTIISEILSLIEHLKPATFDLIKVLLTLLAYKELGLQQTVLCVLRRLGVKSQDWLFSEAEGWHTQLQDQLRGWFTALQDQSRGRHAGLQDQSQGRHAELEDQPQGWCTDLQDQLRGWRAELQDQLGGWRTELQDQPDIWEALSSLADSELTLWTTKFKEHNQFLFKRDSAERQSMTVDPVDVLNFFISKQKEALAKAISVAPPPPPRRKDTMFLSLKDCPYQPIFRLGETYTMSRMRRSAGVTLPPLRNRACLRRFPPFILFPLTHVTLKPFDEEDWVKIYSQRYFVPEEACVEYYR